MVVKELKGKIKSIAYKSNTFMYKGYKIVIEKKQYIELFGKKSYNALIYPPKPEGGWYSTGFEATNKTEVLKQAKRMIDGYLKTLKKGWKKPKYIDERKSL